MIKLVKGVIDFHTRVLPERRELFARLALGQAPDALVIGCFDSRLMLSLLTSANPGDLAVVKNPGNLVPPVSDSIGTSEAAAIETAVKELKVKDIVVCGHSGCVGMESLLKKEGVRPALLQWLRHARVAKERLEAGQTFDPSLSPPNQLSQLNIMLQLEHLMTYPEVAASVAIGALRLHGWWFDIPTGNVYVFEPDERKFVVIDAEVGKKILARITS